MRSSILGCVILLLVVAHMFGEPPRPPSTPPNPINGVYSIIRHCSGQQAAPKLGPNERAVPVASEGPPAEIFVVSDCPEVVLDLAGEPLLKTRPDGVQVLSVQLNQTQAASLHDMTAKHNNEQIAVVVDDVVVMSPKVRSPIEDGRFEISAGNGNLARLKQCLWPAVENEPHR